MSTLLPVEHVSLHVPTLDAICDAFKAGLTSNFADFSVKVVDCPDLRKAPFGLAAPGLSGAPRIADVGGVPNLTPKPKREKVYSLTETLKLTNMENGRGSVIGPGAGNSHFVGILITFTQAACSFASYMTWKQSSHF